MRAAGDMRRVDRHGDRALFLDHFVARAGDDHQVPVRRRFEDVPPLVQQIGAHPAADVGPALRQVAEQLRPVARNRDRRGSSGHQPRSGGESAIGRTASQPVGNFYAMARNPSFSFKIKWRNSAVFSNWHAHCYYYRVHLVPRQRRGGAAVLWSSCSAPSSFLLPRLAGIRRSEQLLKLAALEHLHHDVGSADELALHVELRDGRPVRILP